MYYLHHLCINFFLLQSSIVYTKIIISSERKEQEFYLQQSLIFFGIPKALLSISSTSTIPLYSFVYIFRDLKKKIMRMLMDPVKESLFNGKKKIKNQGILFGVKLTVRSIVDGSIFFLLKLLKVPTTYLNTIYIS